MLPASLPSTAKVRCESSFLPCPVAPSTCWQFRSESILQNKPVRSLFSVADSTRPSIHAPGTRAVFRPANLRNRAWWQLAEALRSDLLSGPPAAAEVRFSGEAGPERDCAPSSAATERKGHACRHTATHFAKAAKKYLEQLLQRWLPVAGCAVPANKPSGNGGRRVLRMRSRPFEEAGASAPHRATLRWIPRG